MQFDVLIQYLYWGKKEMWISLVPFITLLLLGRVSLHPTGSGLLWTPCLQIHTARTLQFSSLNCYLGYKKVKCSRGIFLGRFQSRTKTQEQCIFQYCHCF